VKPRDAAGIFRMPIQRVFSSKGFGTVVTGVPMHGSTTIGETLEVAPLGARGRVRGIHAYGEATDLARAGHSSAINLTDIDYREVHRGMVLTQPGYSQGAKMFEARLSYLASNRRPLVHQTPIRLHVGTAECLGKVYLLEKRSVEPGEEAFVQFRLDEDAVAAPGDRFILRLHSPLETIGGGEILDQSRWRLKLGKRFVLDLLREKEEAIGEPEKLIASTLHAAGYEAVLEKDLARRCGLPVDDTRARLEGLLAGGELAPASRAGLLVSTRRLGEAQAEALRAAQAYFAEHPLRLTMEKQQLRQTLGADEVFFQELLARMASGGVVEEASGGRLRFRDFGPRLKPEDERLKEQVAAATKASPFAPPTPPELADKLGVDPGKLLKLYLLLAEEGELVRLNEDVYLHREALEEARRRLRQHLEAHRIMTASDARNVLGSTRKYCIPLLEALDKEGFTVRKGDFRELRKAGP
jgi:selenocysteine-specific elongation factor